MLYVKLKNQGVKSPQNQLVSQIFKQHKNDFYLLDVYLFSAWKGYSISKSKTGATCGAGSAYPSEAPNIMINSKFWRGSCC